MTAMVKLSGMHGVTFVDPESVAGLFASSVTNDDGGPMCDLALKGGLMVGLGMSAEEAHAALFPEPVKREQFPPLETFTLLPCGGCGTPNPIASQGEDFATLVKCSGCTRDAHGVTAKLAITLWNERQR